MKSNFCILYLFGNKLFRVHRRVQEFTFVILKTIFRSKDYLRTFLGQIYFQHHLSGPGGEDALCTFSNTSLSGKCEKCTTHSIVYKPRPQSQDVHRDILSIYFYLSLLRIKCRLGVGAKKLFRDWFKREPKSNLVISFKWCTSYTLRIHIYTFHFNVKLMLPVMFDVENKLKRVNIFCDLYHII